MPPARLTDPDDPRVAPYRNLTDPARAHLGMVVLEGALVVQRALELGLPIVSALLTEGRARTLAPALEADGAEVLVAERDVLRAVSGYDVHRGVLACARRPPERQASDLLDTARTVTILEGVSDHENLGAIFRSASALGVDAVLLARCGLDPLARRSVRVSMGAVLTVPWARLDPWPVALEAVLARGFTVVALTPAGEVELHRFAPDPRERVALVLGAEGPGLSAEAVAAADVRVRIAMEPGIDSLNVAAAAAIAFHHLRASRL